jgi:hypothetical protein
MPKEFCDLLTLSIHRGGRDTPSRLLLVGARLGYSYLGISLGRKPPGELPGIRAVPVAEEGTREARRATLNYARGGRARRAASSGSADFIIPDPRDRATLRFAAEGCVAVAYPYAQLITEGSTKRSNLIRRWQEMHDNCRRFGCKELLVSSAGDSYLLRNPRDLSAMLHSCIGIGTEEALDWLSSNPREVLERGEERWQSR